MSHEIWIALAMLQEESHEYAVNQGFWDHDETLTDRIAGEHGSTDDKLAELRHCVDSEKIALMHSELSEALDALRDGDMERVEQELADCVIRIADFCERRGLHLNHGVNQVRW